MRKLITCNLLSNSSSWQESVDSPMQLKLINYLGLKKYMMDKFIFRRKQPSYAIRKRNKDIVLYTDSEYIPPCGYTFSATIIETSSHSIPICRLIPQQKKYCSHVIIYAHGNSSDMGDSLRFIEGLSEHIQAQFIAFDYTGYGESRIPHVGEEIIAKDLEILLAWVTEYTDVKNIILWGFSLGTYPVVAAASKFDVGGVILQCPIASISCIFYEQLHSDMKFQDDHFSNLDLIAKIQSKILILHSSSDEIIPISHSKILFEKFTKSRGEDDISFIEVSKIGHNSLHKYIISPNSNQLQSEVFSFILDIIWSDGKNRRNKKSSRSQLQHNNKNNMYNKKPVSAKNKDDQIQESIVWKVDSSSCITSANSSSQNNKSLQSLRMLILQAEIQAIEEDMNQIVVDESQSGKINSRTKNGKISFNRCLCPANEDRH